MSITVDYRASYSSSFSADPATFTACDIGTAGSTRWVAVALHEYTTVTVASVTIGGQAATKAVEQSSISSELIYTSIWYALVPSGTTGDVVLTFGTNPTAFISIDVFRLVAGSGALSVYPVNGTGHDHYTATGDNSLTATVDIPSGGAAICSATTGTSAAKTTTWTNATEASDAGNAVYSYTSAYNTTQGTGTSITAANVSDQNYGALAIAVFTDVAFLLPGLYSNSQTFYAPTVSRPTQPLVAGFYDDSTDTFYSPAVYSDSHIEVYWAYASGDTTGARNLNAPLVDDADTFYAPTVSQTRIYPGLYSDADTFYVPTASGLNSVAPGFHSDYLDSGLVGYWQFDNSALDASGNSQTLTLAGSPSYASGAYGQALSLDGASQYATATVADNDALDLTGPLSICARVKFSSVPGTYAYILSKNESAGFADQQYALVATPTGFAMGIGGVNTTDPPSNFTISTGVFYDVVATYDGTNARIYVDDALIGTYPLSPSFAFKSILSIGRRSNAAGGSASIYFFPGTIDEVRVYSRALSRNEISALHTGANTFFAPVAHATAGVQPSLYDDADTFYSPTVVHAGTLSLAPDLFANDAIFYVPTAAQLTAATAGTGVPWSALNYPGAHAKPSSLLWNQPVPKRLKDKISAQEAQGAVDRELLRQAEELLAKKARAAEAALLRKQEQLRRKLATEKRAALNAEILAIEEKLAGFAAVIEQLKAEQDMRRQDEEDVMAIMMASLF